MRCVALLRGINVGGKNLIRMANLRCWVEELGFQDVTTYIQSGNVLFEAENSNMARAQIEAKLAAEERPVRAVLRTAEEMRALIAASPFGPDADKRHVVTFLDGPGSSTDLVSASPALEVVLRREQEVFFHYEVVNGRVPDPNKLCEKALGVVATTRNWPVVRALAQLML